MPSLKIAILSRVGPVSLGVHFLPPLLISFAFYLLSTNEILWIQLALAIALLQISWTAYLDWKKKADEKLPVFAVIAFIYWVYYALSLFWCVRTVSGIDSPFETTVSEKSITWSLAMAVTGISAVWLGMRMGLGKRFIPGKLPELKRGLTTLHYLRFLLMAGTLLSFYETLPNLAGEGGQQILSIVISTVPILAFVILFRRILAGEAEPIDKAFVFGFLMLRLVIGLSSGWLGSFAAIIVICGATYIAERRRIPQLALVLVILFTLFFQVGKQDFRQAYWKSEVQTSKIDRVKFWTETSFSKWEEALSDPSGGALVEAINQSLYRISLLTQTANVIDLTPSVVPYQGAQLYSYLAVTLIPRAVWPDKPSMNEANQFYQVAYGLNTKEELENVSIGVGVMTEAYISFGWYGVVGIMFLMGIFYDVYRNMFFTNRVGWLMTALGIALLPQMMSIESQMAAYLGGIVQQVGFTLLVFLPVIRWRNQQNRAELSQFAFPPRTNAGTIVR